MSTTKIEIKGPGGTINYLLEVITKALREAGLTVDITNDHSTENSEELIRLIKGRIDNGDIMECRYKS